MMWDSTLTVLSNHSFFLHILWMECTLIARCRPAKWQLRNNLLQPNKFRLLKRWGVIRAAVRWPRACWASLCKVARTLCRNIGKHCMSNLPRSWPEPWGCFQGTLNFIRVTTETSFTNVIRTLYHSEFSSASYFRNEARQPNTQVVMKQ